MRKTLLSVILMLSLATMVASGTLANLSDIEASHNNYVETGSFDIKVAKADENWNGSDFRDDQPLGAGLEPIFNISCAKICNTYCAYLLLWNSGQYEQLVDGIASLQIKLTGDTANIADTTTLRILFDIDGDNDLEEVAFTSLQSLNLSPVTLGLLPSEAIRRLQLEIHPKFGPCETIKPFELAFRVDFRLTQMGDASFSDIESSTAYLKSCVYHGCTPGFWQGGNGKKLWNAVNDPDWTAAGGQGSNPFIWTTLFNDFFTPHPNLAGLTMMDLVGTGGGSDPVQKAARDLVAAYLNAAFGTVMNYPLSTGELANLWTAAVNTGTPTFGDLHDLLNDYNNLGSPF
jgi:hypothetical protein